MPVPRRDLEKTHASLTAWLHRQLPQAQALKLSPLSGPEATGFSNDTLLFDLSYQEGGQSRDRALVCRAEPITDFRIFPGYDVVQQYRIMDALSGTGVPVPGMMWLEPDSSVLGSPFFVMERVPGRIPTDNPPYHAGGWVFEIEPDERRALWQAAVDALAAIHRQDPEALGLDFLTAPPADADACAWQLEHWSSYCDWVTAGQRQPVLDAALAWLRARRPPSDDPRRLCWGDARIGNMIFHAGRCEAVLDWEMATLAPPEMDLGWFLYMDRHHSEGIGMPRLSGLPDREETVARWEGHLGRPARNLEYWEAFAAFRFAAIMTRVAQQLMHFGILPADSPFAVDNTASRMLARVLELPWPGQT
ncbi:phosphotransferase family protein [Myxococcota bacterium]|nr:phosphotransferase family protein [Myxococcota bacterium]MCZ7618186.1 phosphotransferase family protein [Myxococcota bacterium]